MPPGVSLQGFRKIIRKLSCPVNGTPPRAAGPGGPPQRRISLPEAEGPAQACPAPSQPGPQASNQPASVSGSLESL